MQAAAASEKMKFIDGSESTLQSYKVFQEGNSSFHFATPVTYFGIENAEGMGLIAGNIESQSYNVVVGFNSGKYSVDNTKAFAARITRALKQYWTVETVPLSQGAGTLQNCDNNNLGKF